MLRLKSLAGALLLAVCSVSFAANGYLFSLPKQTTFNEGAAVPGAKVFFYADGTTTKQAIYSDAGLTTPLSNPVEADAYGKLPSIFLDPELGEYKVVIAPSGDTDPPSSAYETVDDYPSGISAGSIGSVLYPQTAAEVTAGVTPTNLQYPATPEIDLRRYNSDFDVAYAEGLSVAQASGLPLRIDADYSQGEAVEIASLTGPLQIVGTGSITYAGSAVNHMLRVLDTNGYDVRIEGITFDADQLAAKTLRFDNPSPSMADSNIGTVTLRNVRMIDPYLSTGLTVSSSGVMVDGGFKEVILDNILIRNVDRDTGAGNPGSRGSQAVVVTFEDLNGYVEKLTVLGGLIDTVTNNETTGTGDDVDVDGIAFSGPTATTNSGVHLRQTFLVDGTKFVNNKGRAVKSQINGFSIVKNVTIVRNLEEGINNSRDFDFQRGGGIVSDVVFYAERTSGGGTVWGSSHAIVASEFDQDADTGDNRDGSITVQNLTIYSDIPAATDNLPFILLANTDDETRTLQNIRVRNVAAVGGRVARVVSSSTITGDARALITIEGFEGRVNNSLIQFTQAVDKEVIVKLIGNIAMSGSETPVLVELASNVEPLVTGHSNIGGWTANLRPNSSANTVGELLRTRLITNHNDNNSGIGAIVPPMSVDVADDGTHTFTAIPASGIAFITTNSSDTTQAIIAYDANSIIEITADSADTDIAASNPDTDGDLNIYLNSGQIEVKNRLGTNQRISLTAIGG